MYLCHISILTRDGLGSAHPATDHAQSSPTWTHTPLTPPHSYSAHHFRYPFLTCTHIKPFSSTPLSPTHTEKLLGIQGGVLQPKGKILQTHTHTHTTSQSQCHKPVCVEPWDRSTPLRLCFCFFLVPITVAKSTVTKLLKQALEAVLNVGWTVLSVLRYSTGLLPHLSNSDWMQTAKGYICAALFKNYFRSRSTLQPQWDLVAF